MTTATEISPPAAISDDLVQEHCRGLYLRTRQLWQSMEGRYSTWECRFSILYGPPTHRPDLLIVGANPGYDPRDLYDEEIESWPLANEYVVKDWPLARRLRSIFRDAGLPQLLERSLGTNLLFFKSASLASHSNGFGWADNPGAARTVLERHCKNEMNALIPVLAPRAILVLGLTTFERFTAGRGRGRGRAVVGPSGRRVAAIGRIEGTKVVGIIHPTGAQVATMDWSDVSSCLAEELGNGMIASVLPLTNEGNTARSPDAEVETLGNSRPSAGSRQSPFRRDTIVEAATKPAADFGYQPIHDFWRELATTGPITIEDFLHHMVATGWRRPQAGDLTFAVTRTDIASMCKRGYARRLS